MFKKVFIHFRRTIKIVSVVSLGALLIFGAVSFIYKPIYSVSLNGEFIGYCANKSELQNDINDYMKHGEEEQVAFVQIDNLPKYEMCLLKKNIVTNDEEILQTVKETGVPYYEYYAIVQDGQDKLYTASQEEAEKAISQLKEKNSKNKDQLGCVQKYLTDKQECVNVETAVSKLYEEPPKEPVYVAKNSSGVANTSKVANTSGPSIALGVNLAKPISGVITSRFGNRHGSTHTGLDIGAPRGTPIKAAAAGTVTFSGWKGSYGNLIIITHTNKVQTYYAHCSVLKASVGQTVSQGDVVALVGSTGNSTGNHLHLEIRINGVAQNPQRYLY